RSSRVRRTTDISDAARSRRPRVRVSRCARRKARTSGSSDAGDSWRWRFSDECAGDRDRRAASHQCGDARHEQQLLGVGEGVPEAVLRWAIHRLRHRQSTVRRVCASLRRGWLLRRASRSGRRCGAQGARWRQARDHRDPDRSRRVPDAGAGGASGREVAAVRSETIAAIDVVARALELAKRTNGPGEIACKSGRDVVTATDIAVEDAVRELLTRTSTTPVFGEERGGHTPADGSPYWLVDPICGTRNFASGSPLYCVNLALVE